MLSIKLAHKTGQYEVDQLAKIFSVLGTPEEAEWPEESSVMRNSFPYSRPRSISEILPEIDPLAKDLMEVREWIVTGLVSR